LFLPRRFFFGLYEVPNWGYMCGFSMAYIEIMNTDTLLHDYHADKKDGKVISQDALRETLEYWEKEKVKYGK
jgi:hypothetical protein